jgi:drug/metabolite transporter (DMT)-like permease
METVESQRPADRLATDKRALRADTLLLVTAAIWGFAFVAQRVGMAHVGPFTFNGVRFGLGSLSLLPLLMFTSRRASPARRLLAPASPGALVWGGGLAGLCLFCGASLQQVGLVYTTAGNAGFITGLYVVIVPLLGLLVGQRTNLGTWLGAGLAAVGLYFLSITADFRISRGDFLELLGAFFWAAHVLIIGWLSPRLNALKLAITQFAACSLLSLLTAAAIETITLEGLRQALLPILYGGLCSVGIAYTLQVVAQKDAQPAHAAILLSLEAVFAALGGWLLLDETLAGRSLFGCGLMLAGMLLTQLWGLRR